MESLRPFLFLNLLILPLSIKKLFHSQKKNIMEQPLLEKDEPMPMPTGARVMKGVAAFSSVFDHLVLYVAVVTTFVHFAFFITCYIYSPGFLLADDLPLWWIWFSIASGFLYIIVWMTTHLLTTVSQDDFTTWYGWAFVAAIVFVAIALGLGLVYVIRCIYYFATIAPGDDTDPAKFWVLWGFAVAMCVGFIIQIVTYIIQALGNFEYGAVEYAQGSFLTNIPSSVAGAWNTGVSTIRRRIVNKPKHI